MFSQFFRKKQLDAEQLLHSEWNRRLGLFSLVGISGQLILTTVYFIILPNLLALRLQSVPTIPYLFVFVLVILGASQWGTIAKLVPRNGLLFNFAYITHFTKAYILLAV